MPSGLIALLDDVATLAKLAASSMDDIGAAVGKAGSKAAGVVIDDTAVTPRYVTGLSPERELPIIGKIALGSLKNKLLIILPVALFLSWLGQRIGLDIITPLLMIGGAYLCFEGAEKLWEKLSGDHHAEAELLACDDATELENRQVAGAIRTDFILSAEIMVIALAALELSAFWLEAVVLAVVGIVHHRDGLRHRRADREAGRHRAAHGGARRSRCCDRARAGQRRAQAARLAVGGRDRGDAVGRRADPAARHGSAAHRGIYNDLLGRWRFGRGKEAQDTGV
jgi:hypothetical protein